MIRPIKLPLLWFSKERPSADTYHLRPVQVCPSFETPTLGVWPPGHTHLPSLSFFPTSTVYSANGLVGLLHPTTGHGVRAVSATISLTPHCCDAWSLVPFPGSHIIPFEAFPFVIAFMCHHSRCLLAVVYPHCFQQVLTRPQGFAPLQNPLLHRDVAIVMESDAPLGFVPLQGSPLNPECVIENLRSDSAEAESLWASTAEALGALNLPTPGCERDTNGSCPFLRLYSVHCLPRQRLRRSAKPCRPADRLASLPLSFSGGLSCTF